jgi:hypothetical protein
MRVDQKRIADERSVAEMLYRKETDRTVPKHRDMFYNSAYTIIPHIDYQYQTDWVHEALLQDQPEDEDGEEMKYLMRMIAPPLTYNNEQPGKKKKKGPAMQKYDPKPEVWVTHSPEKKAPVVLEGAYGGLSVPHQAERDFLSSP